MGRVLVRIQLSVIHHLQCSCVPSFLCLFPHLLSILSPPSEAAAILMALRTKIRTIAICMLTVQTPSSSCPFSVSTTGGLYPDFIRLLFLRTCRGAALVRELPEECYQFRFFRAV